MSKKVSIIIPNYNAEAYIERCLNSILNQNYSNIEIIIIDDGSTDNSWQKILWYANQNKVIKAIRQENMNASIARNKGIEIATGEYLFFLDSDDILYPDSLTKMVECMEKDQSDMVIGNFHKIDVQDNVIMDCCNVKQSEVINDTMSLAKMVPNPSNKLYKASIVLKYGIVFGNVRIGQDLNFYLKYLLKCQKISLFNKNIYGWRVVSDSISNKASFRIFDITESFKDVHKFYIQQGASNLYDEYISMVEYCHYYLQMEKQVLFSDSYARKIIVDYFIYHLRQMNVRKCLNFSENRKDYHRCQWKMRLKIFYVSKFYSKLMRWVKQK